jgi:hypothetical protein
VKSSSLTSGQRRAVVLTGVLWATCILIGSAIMVNEEFTAAQSAPISSAFPKNSPLTLAAGKPTLVLFLHPHCPCSRATLRELEKVVTRTQDMAAVEIVFTIPAGTPPGWEKGDLWNRAHAIPGASVVRDQNGIAARRFGVIGSGHTLLYAPSGRLLFSGGITASRGEEGDNPGESAVVNFVLHGHSEITHTPVFGCELL